MRIILASASPRRRELIKKINKAEIIVRPSSCVERTDKVVPRDIVEELSVMKALDVHKYYPDDIVIAADTIVCLGTKIYGKPKSEFEAAVFLKELSGHTHDVLTGVTIINGKRSDTFCERTLVTFGPFDEKLIDSYIKTGKPLDKAGAYGAQDKEIKSLILKIDGDKDNVIGLPVERIIKELEENYGY